MNIFYAVKMFLCYRKYTYSKTVLFSLFVNLARLELCSHYTYKGCYYLSLQFILGNTHIYHSWDNSTTEVCIDVCNRAGYQFAGTCGANCYCGNGMTKYLQRNSTECNIQCPGNKNEFCGGQNRISVFDTLDVDKQFHCTFDHSLCGWTQSKMDNFDWTRNSGRTPSALTGPYRDHATPNGYYMYIETSFGRQGDNAKLISPSFNMTASVTYCFSFWYNMYSLRDTIGTLAIYVKTSQVYQNVWKTSGNHGKAWLKADVNIRGFNDQIQIVIQASKGSNYQGDIAIDDTSLTEGKCKSSNLGTGVTTQKSVPVNGPVRPVNGAVQHDTTSSAIGGGTVVGIVVIVSSFVLLLCLAVVAFKRMRKRSRAHSAVNQESLRRHRPVTLSASPSEIRAHALGTQPVSRDSIDNSSTTLTTLSAVDSQSPAPDMLSEVDNQSMETVLTERQYDPPDYETLFTGNSSQDTESHDTNGTHRHIHLFTITLPGIDEQTENRIPSTSLSPSTQAEILFTDEATPPPAYSTLSSTYFPSQNDQTGDRNPPRHSENIYKF